MITLVSNYQNFNENSTMNPPNKKSHRSAIILAGGAVSILLLLLPFLFPMTGKPGPNWVAAAGRVHILALHFPIALTMLVPLLEVLTRTRFLNELNVAIYPLLLLAALSSASVSVLGFMLAQGDGTSGKLIIEHMRGGIITSILLVATVLLKAMYLQKSGIALQAAYFITLGCGLLSLISTSHYGASLVHGEDFLYEKLPAGLQPLFGATPSVPRRITEDSNLYDHVIEPIFRSHCFECHGKDKSKGGYRMDNFEHLLSGGDGGMPGIEPRNLEESEVHYRITRQSGAKALMPPKTAPPLSARQIELISWWIESGASPAVTIGDVLKSTDSSPIKQRVAEMLSENQ